MYKNIDLLTIEAFSFAPHLETGGEISVLESERGRSVGYAFLRVDNPDNRIPLRQRLRGADPVRRVQALERVLAEHGVSVIIPPRLDSETWTRVIEFSHTKPASLGALSALEYQGASLGLGVTSSLISYFSDTEVELSRHPRLLRRFLLASALIYETTTLLLNQYQPSRVLTFNGRLACARPIAESARKLNIPTLYHERGADKERYEVFTSRPHDLRYIRQRVREVWSSAPDDREQVAKSFFERRKSGDGIGWFTFVDAQTSGLCPPKTDKRRFVYYSSSDDEFAALGELSVHPLFDNQRQAVMFLCEQIAARNDAELIIRVHPHLRYRPQQENRWWNSLSRGAVSVVPAESPVDSYALAATADVILSYGSTMGMEAAYWGRPSILLGDALYSGFDCNYEPGSASELRSLLESPYITSLPSKNTLPVGYYSTTYGKHHKLYRPISLHSGTFLGEHLSSDTPTIHRIRRWLRRTYEERVSD